MAFAAPGFLLMFSAAQEKNAWCFDILDRASLAPLGYCALHCPSAYEERSQRSLTVDAPEALRPAIRRAALRWHDQQIMQSALITLDDGNCIDTGRASPEAEALCQTFLLKHTSFSSIRTPHGRFCGICEKTPGDFAWVMNLSPRFDGLLLEAGFAFPMSMPEGWEAFKSFGCTGTDIRLRVVRLVASEDELTAALAEAEALRHAWFDKSRDALKKEIAARQKAFAARITAQLKPLGFRKKALHWTYARPDGYHVDFNAQKSSYTDAFYFNLLLTEPDKHPWYAGLIDERPLGNMLDWQAMPGEDFDNLLHAVVHRCILPLMNEPIEQLTSKGGSHERA